MGLIVEVLRHTRGGVIENYTNDGVSGYADRLCLVNVDGPFEPGVDAPAAILESHMPGILRIVPAGLGCNGYVPVRHSVRIGPMMGGNYAATSDSRFGDACFRIIGHRFYGAVAIHDRWESQEQYNSYD